MRLTKGMYGHQFHPESNYLFGLRCGQLRGGDWVHNGGWYNHLGEKLGWGDLSIEDLARIRDALTPSECFIILGESDSFWEFVDHIGVIGSMCGTKPTIEAPGVDYVVKKARLAIIKDHIFVIRNDDDKDSYSTRESIENGVKFEPLSRSELLKRISVIK